MPKSQVNNQKIDASNAETKANEFNQYFSSIGAELASKIKEHPDLLHYENNVYTAGDIKFKFHSVCEDDVHKEIMKLKDNTSVGLDGISSKIFENECPCHCSLSHIYY